MKFKPKSNSLLLLATLAVLSPLYSWQRSLQEKKTSSLPERQLSSPIPSTASLERKLDQIGESYKSPSKRKLFLKAKKFLLKSLKKRKLNLSMVTRKKKKKSRKLMLSMILDLIKGAKGYLNPLLMPTLMPQVSDPRITIQTFNPPNNAVLPPDLGPKALNFDIKMPDIYASGPDIVRHDVFIKEDVAKSRVFIS